MELKVKGSIDVTILFIGASGDHLPKGIFILYIIVIQVLLVHYSDLAYPATHDANQL